MNKLKKPQTLPNSRIPYASGHKTKLKLFFKLKLKPNNDFLLNCPPACSAGGALRSNAGAACRTLPPRQCSVSPRSASAARTTGPHSRPSSSLVAVGQSHSQGLTKSLSLANFRLFFQLILSLTNMWISNNQKIDKFKDFVSPWSQFTTFCLLFGSFTSDLVLMRLSQ